MFEVLFPRRAAAASDFATEEAVGLGQGRYETDSGYMGEVWRRHVQGYAAACCATASAFVAWTAGLDGQPLIAIVSASFMAISSTHAYNQISRLTLWQRVDRELMDAADEEANHLRSELGELSEENCRLREENARLLMAYLFAANELRLAGEGEAAKGAASPAADLIEFNGRRH